MVGEGTRAAEPYASGGSVKEADTEVEEGGGRLDPRINFDVPGKL